MGVLSSLLAQNVDRSPSSDFWYQPVGAISKAGVHVSEDQVMRISPVIQGVRFVAQTIAGLPRGVFRHSADGRSRERAMRHPLNRILQYEPNNAQTAFQFVESTTAQAILHGVSMAEKVYGDDAELEAILPINPRSIARIERTASGKLRYVIRQEDGRARTLLQDDVFVLPGFGLNGVRGFPLLDSMRETAGLAIATEEYGAAFFANSAMPRVVLESPKEVGVETRRRMKDDWNLAYGGDRQHGTALLEEGTKIEVLSTKNDEAQFIETKKFLIAEFSRHLDVTPHRLSDMEKTSYNNVEQMSLETVVYTLSPWVQRWEQCSYRDLLSRDDKDSGHYVKFDLRGLLRGDTSARQSFYQSGINSGWLTRNEVRELEDFNPLEGLDEPLQPQNMAPVGSMPQAAVKPEPESDAEELESESRARAIVRAAAERCVRREVAGAEKWNQRKNGNDAERKTHLEIFYRDHAGFMAQALAMDAAKASSWCATRCAEVLNGGLSLADDEAIHALTMEALK